MQHYNYSCPHCTGECSVEESLTNNNVICPACSGEFFATPPEGNSQVILPEKVPFFKAGRKKLLQEKLGELVADGELSAQDKDTLNRMALMMDVKLADMDDIRRGAFISEFKPLQERIQFSGHMRDEDQVELEALQRKFGINLEMNEEFQVYRQTYLLEEKGELPPPVYTAFDFGPTERAYFVIRTSWHQERSQNRVAQVTPLASGLLYITSKRVFFDGQNRNCSIHFGKILQAGSYRDCLKIEKSTGKDDYFPMAIPGSRFCAALIRALGGRS